MVNPCEFFVQIAWIALKPIAKNSIPDVKLRAKPLSIKDIFNLKVFLP